MDTIEYVCPECGSNDDITEVSLAHVHYRGQFDDQGLVQMFDTETPMIGENPNDPETYYICGDCQNEFQNPLTKEDYDNVHKDEQEPNEEARA